MSDFVLYRAFDLEGRLLYIGSTNDVRLRMDQHRKSAQWFSRMALFTTEPFATEDEVRIAERAAIQNEQPPYNISHTPRIYGPRPRATSDGAMKIGDLEVLTLGQAAKRIGVDRTVLWRQVQRGALHPVNDEPPYLVSLDELARYEREHKGKRGNYDHKTARRGRPRASREETQA